MSLILRRPFVGAAKYVRTMSGSRLPKVFNAYTEFFGDKKLQFHWPKIAEIEAEKKKTNTWKTIRAAAKKILPVRNKKVEEVEIVQEQQKLLPLLNYLVSLKSSNLGLVTKDNAKKFSFPAKFETSFNGLPIKSISNQANAENELPISYEFGKLNISLNGDELKLKIKNRDEIFILKHAVYVKAKKTKDESPEASIKQNIVGPIRLNDISSDNPKLTLNEAENKSLQPYGTELRVTSANHLKGLESDYLYDNENTIIDKDTGRVELVFPMVINLKGYEQTILIKETEETFTIGYTVDLKVYKEFNENLKNESVDVKIIEAPKEGKFDIVIESGDLLLETRDSCHESLVIKQEVWIDVDLDAEVPMVNIYPCIKRGNLIVKTEDA